MSNNVKMVRGALSTFPNRGIRLFTEDITRKYSSWVEFSDHEKKQVLLRFESERFDSETEAVSALVNHLNKAGIYLYIAKAYGK